MKNVLIALAVLVVVGFGTYSYVFKGDDHDSEYGFEPTENTQSVPSIPATTANDPEVSKNEEFTINIKNFVFSPPVVNIKVGTKITWVNGDSVRHSAISSTGNLLKSSLLAQGESFSFTFTDAGTVDYYCGPHPSMKGRVVVTD